MGMDTNMKNSKSNKALSAFKAVMNAIKNFFTKKKITAAIISFGVSLVLMAVIAVTSVSSSIKKTTADRIVDLNGASELYGIDCIVVLGAYVKTDGQPSDMLRDRLDTALALYNAGVSDRIIVSGDHGRAEYKEVGIMKRYLVENGVPSECVFMDHAGFSTYETMYRTNAIFFGESYYKRVVIVTQEYHLYRSLYIAKNVGLDAYGVSADLHTYGGQAKREVREVLARFKDFFSCYFNVSPKYLGEQISIYGSGDQTNDAYYEELLGGLAADTED